MLLSPWVHCTAEALVVETDCLTFAMETFDLKLAKFHVEVVDKIFKDIPALRHKFRRLLVCQHFLDVLFGALKVRE